MRMIKKSIKFLENKIALIRENNKKWALTSKEKYELELFEFMLDSFESVEGENRVEQYISWLESEIKTLENKALKKYFSNQDKDVYEIYLSEEENRKYYQLKDELKVAGKIKANTEGRNDD